jgi:hypothetical protein
MSELFAGFCNFKLQQCRNVVSVIREIRTLSATDDLSTVCAISDFILTTP